MLAHDDAPVSGRKAARFRHLVLKRRIGLPVAYITGTKEFYAMPFFVTPAVLIPKPDTETLVEEALAVLKGRGTSACLKVLDMCTGSGCIAISILRNSAVPVTVTAVDISAPALRVARENARRLLCADERRRLQFAQSDLFADLPANSTFDLIVSNPPYVPTDTAAALLRDGRGEPLLALDGGPGGLDFPKRLICEAAAHLAPGGSLLLEVGDGQAQEVAAAMEAAGLCVTALRRDCTGMERVVAGVQRKSTPLAQK
jgi:release factor glutamine methyltransferase